MLDHTLTQTCPSPHSHMHVPSQALSSVLYASSRCPELEELVKLRAMFEHKYGKVRGGEGGQRF